jgi:hypothetical protein
VAWIRRITHPGNKDRVLSTKERKQASEAIILMMQRNFYRREMEELQHGRSVAANSTLAGLNPTLDESGVLRVGGRLSKSSLPEHVKHPCISPKESAISFLIIRRTDLPSGIWTDYE